jgi:hypothetical protein
MLTRCSFESHWHYLGNIGDGANLVIPCGNIQTAFDPTGAAVVGLMPTLFMPFFSIDVLTDDAVEVDVEQGCDITALFALVTLTCGVGLGHNTVYDLPPPHNTDGFLVLTSPWTRLRVRNATGGIVTPFELIARVWR